MLCVVSPYPPHLSLSPVYTRQWARILLLLFFLLQQIAALLPFIADICRKKTETAPGRASAPSPYYTPSVRAGTRVS